MPSEYAFKVNENALCFHGAMLYVAKILDREIWDEKTTKSGEIGPHYFVHFYGWNKKWDDWIPQSRVIKHDEAGLDRQREVNNKIVRVKDAAVKAKAKAGSPSRSKASPAPGAIGDKGGKGAAAQAAKGKKRTRESAFETEADYIKRPEVKIPIPDELKVKLVDDWQNVTYSQQLVPLPRTPSVKQITEEYKAHIIQTKKFRPDGRTPTPQEALVKEIMTGLVVYFDKALGNNLLYAFERQQYANQLQLKGKEVLEGTVAWSEVYGAEHLLRLFVNLPRFIAHTTMDAASVKSLSEHVQDMMKWMIKEQARLFLTEYEATTPEYQNKSRAR